MKPAGNISSSAPWASLLRSSEPSRFTWLRSAAAFQPAQALDWTALMAAAPGLSAARDLLRLAFVFVAVGYGTKIGFVPMHSWLPDAHAEAPAPISAMLSAVLLNCAMYALLRC